MTLDSTSEALRERPREDTDDLARTERAAEPPLIDTDDEVEQAAIDSFPASDPPSFTPSRPGSPSSDPIDDSR